MYYLTSIDLGYSTIHAVGNFVTTVSFPAKLVVSSRQSRNLPGGNPSLNNLSAGGKNDPAWFCYWSDTKAFPALWNEIR